jgi:ribose 1,5-bisphosphokinase PhnN
MWAAGVPALVLTGPCGVGKTTVLGAVCERLEAAGVPHAAVDMDALRCCYPRPADDPFHTRLGLRNLAAVWRAFRAAGAERLVLADIVEGRRSVAGLRRALHGAVPAVVRLRASPATLAARLGRRETGAALEWHLRRAQELTVLMERRGVGDCVVDTDGATAAEVAVEVLRAIGWTV